MAPNHPASDPLDEEDKRSIVTECQSFFPGHSEKELIKYLERYDWDIEKVGAEIGADDENRIREKQQRLSVSIHGTRSNSKDDSVTVASQLEDSSDESEAHSGTGSSGARIKQEGMEDVVIDLSSDHEEDEDQAQDGGTNISDIYGVSDDEKARNEKRAASKESPGSARKKSRKALEGFGDLRNFNLEGRTERGGLIESIETEQEDQSAAEWVKERFMDQHGDVAIVFDSGAHTTRFPRQHLERYFAFFRELVGRPAIVQVPFVCKVMFDIILRWVGERTITLTEARKSTPSIEINSLMILAYSAQQLGTKKGLEQAVADRMRVIARENRHNITKHHIERAYDWFKSGHPVRKVIVQCLLHPYMNYSRANRLLSDQISDTPSYPFHEQISKIEDLRNELNQEVVIAVHGRDPHYEGGRGRGRRRSESKDMFTDPLIEDGRGSKFKLE